MLLNFIEVREITTQKSLRTLFLHLFFLMQWNVITYGVLPLPAVYVLWVPHATSGGNDWFSSNRFIESCQVFESVNWVPNWGCQLVSSTFPSLFTLPFNCISLSVSVLWGHVKLWWSLCFTGTVALMMQCDILLCNPSYNFSSLPKSKMCERLK